MEHRFAPRVAMQVNVVIHLTGTTLVTGITRNISSEGIYLQLNKARDLRKDVPNRIKKNQLVRVALNAGERLVIMPSMVVRSQDNAVALVFSEDASSKKELLKGFLYGGTETVPELRGAFSRV